MLKKYILNVITSPFSEENKPLILIQNFLKVSRRDHGDTTRNNYAL